MKHVRESLLWVVVSLWMLVALLPANLWYEPGSLRIDDHGYQENFELLYDGYVEHTFKGSYSVVVRDISTRQIVHEETSGIFTYQQDSERPVPLLKDWWAPQMGHLEPGSYEMETCWTVHNPLWGLVPSKTTCTQSNIFRVVDDQDE